MISKVLITPVGMECNLRCGYCYNGSQRHSVTKPSKVISEEILCKIFTEIHPFCKSGFLDIIWHGGEPLLAGQNFYRQAIAIEKECLEGKIKFINCIQTNATLVDESWCDLFEELNFFPSTSLDGPQFLHDQIRIDSKRSGSYDKAFKGYKLIKSRGIRCGLLTVVTPVNVDHSKTIFQWILDTGITSLDILFCAEPEKIKKGELSFEVTQEQAINFATKLFDLWFKHNDPTIKIRMFRDVLLSEMGGQPGICSWRLGCLKHISFDELGNVYLCARFNVFPETSFGNIMQNSFAKIMLNEHTVKIHKEIINGMAECQKCEWQKACGSGCPFLKYAFYGKFDAPFAHCEIRKAIFKHVRQSIWQDVSMVVS